ncbi:hypothetical protein AT746_04225 [Lacimicrobium alkaliphilum]|uniref:Uncharacterized protein n=1 Tax=Lacimicrobium alkaliphilum TaxID=1526571 RepID=A0A0U3AFT1_9ALTE|nr:hypothetical protein AT746_04225 [Lacimicrobium alkaliphilum]
MAMSVAVCVGDDSTDKLIEALRTAIARMKVASEVKPITRCNSIINKGFKISICCKDLLLENL